jgi:hypothetical protein
MTEKTSKIAQNWKAFGEKTRWMETGAGRKLIMVLAIALCVYGFASAMVTHHDRTDTGSANSSYELTE